MSDSNSIFTDIMNFEPATEVTVVENNDLVELKTPLEEDFETARENLRQIAEYSAEAMTEFARMTKQLQDPRAYSTFSKLVTSSILAQKAIVEIHKNKVEGRDPTEPSLAPQTVNNTLILTTDELQKKLKELVAPE